MKKERETKNRERERKEKRNRNVAPVDNSYVSGPVGSSLVNDVTAPEM